MLQKMLQVGGGGTSETPIQVIDFTYSAQWSSSIATQTYTAERDGVLHFYYGNYANAISAVSINGNAKTPKMKYDASYTHLGYYVENIRKGDVITVTQSSSGNTTIINSGWIADE